MRVVHVAHVREVKPEATFLFLDGLGYRRNPAIR